MHFLYLQHLWQIYSGKFSLVQIFTDLPFRPSEEIFVVLNFVPALNLVLANACEDVFYGSYFCGNQIIREILHHVKISRYTVAVS